MPKTGGGGAGQAGSLPAVFPCGLWQAGHWNTASKLEARRDSKWICPFGLASRLETMGAGLGWTHKRRPTRKAVRAHATGSWARRWRPAAARPAGGSKGVECACVTTHVCVWVDACGRTEGGSFGHLN
jgi:hypothetical protein